MSKTYRSNARIYRQCLISNNAWCKLWNGMLNDTKSDGLVSCDVWFFMPDPSFADKGARKISFWTAVPRLLQDVSICDTILAKNWSWVRHYLCPILKKCGCWIRDFYIISKANRLIKHCRSIQEGVCYLMRLNRSGLRRNEVVSCCKSCDLCNVMS